MSDWAPGTKLALLNTVLTFDGSANNVVTNVAGTYRIALPSGRILDGDVVFDLALDGMALTTVGDLLSALKAQQGIA
jgi:hypothetical protein